MVLLMGYLHVQSAELDAFLVSLATAANETRKEEGCLFYAFGVEDAAEGRVLLAQRWEDEATLGAHMRGPQAAAFQKEWAGRVRLDIQRFDTRGDN